MAQLGFVGLGKMGAGMVRRLLAGSHEVAGFDFDQELVKELAAEGMTSSSGLAELVSGLAAPRIVWLMIPAGEPVENTIGELIPLLSPGDILIDGGNSRFSDSVRRAKLLRESKIEFMDVGTSGGVWGLEVGFCLMVGGEKKAFSTVEPFFKTLAPENGYLHVGAAGSGHFVKMIHNGIEYGVMQAYAEGFELLEESKFDLDSAAIADLWNHGSVIRSWLLELGADALREDPKLSSLVGYVSDSGAVPTPVIASSLFTRFRSRRENTFSDRFLAALRNQFGGHAVKKAKAK